MNMLVLTLFTVNRPTISRLQPALVNTTLTLEETLRPQQPICAAALIVLMTANGDASCRLPLSTDKTGQLKVERVIHTLCTHPHIVPNQCAFHPFYLLEGFL